jgi:hypothetical protein
MGRIAAAKKLAPRPITMNATTGGRAMMRSRAAINSFCRYPACWAKAGRAPGDRELPPAALAQFAACLLASDQSES